MAVGALLVYAVHAATSVPGYVPILLSGVTPQGNAAVVSDSGAITTDHTAIKFGSSTAASGGGGGGGAASDGCVASGPCASALSAYKTLSQAFTAQQMVNGNWAKNANDTLEGNNICPTSSTTYDSANDAVKLSTGGKAVQANGTQVDCAHIRSTDLISTNGTVVESRVWLPGSGSTLIDWASYWTDGTNWSRTGELDAIETQYGVSYSSYHYGANNSVMSTTPVSWGDPQAPVINPGNDAVPGWNTVDMEFESNYAGANVYINGKLYCSFPGSILPHNGQYINWGISGPNAGDPNHASWPSGAGYEEIQYLKVFTK